MIRVVGSIDDGCKLDIKVGKMLLRYGIETIFYLPVDVNHVAAKTGFDPLNNKQMDWLNDNFEIGSHTITHPLLTRISGRQMVKEIFGSKELLAKRFGREIDSFAYPRGYANDHIRHLVKRAGYRQGRSTLVGWLDESPDPFWQHSTVHIAGKRRPEYARTTWLEEGRRLWQEAKSLDAKGQDCVYSFFGHSWEIERYKAWDEFEDFLQMVSG